MNLKKVLLELSVQGNTGDRPGRGPGKGPGVYPGKTGQAGEKGFATPLSAGFRGQLRPGSKGPFYSLIEWI